MYVKNNVNEFETVKITNKNIMILNKKEIEQVKKNAKIHKKIFDEIKKNIKIWINAFQIDKLVWDLCKKYDVIPWFKWVYEFPANICISINDVVVHWIPKKNMVFKNWDLVKFDFWVKDKNIWINTDAAFSVIIWNWPHDKELERFLEVNKEALYIWINECRIWKKTWDIWAAIQNHVEKAWFYIVRDLTWHWLWYNLHEKPYIYNYWTPWKWEKLKENMLLAVEPIIWFSSWEIYDKWWFEFYIKDWSYWSQFEHTVLVTKNWPEIII